MIVKQNVTLYKCEFCNKELKRKHAMERHELGCSGNPTNYRACLSGCKYLQRTSIEYDSGILEYGDGEPIFKQGHGFICTKLNKLLLHPKVEGESLLSYVYLDGQETEQHGMPKKCEHYNDNIFDFE